MLQPGDKAPDFKLLTTTGELFQLSDKLREAAVVLYFYPKDETRGCTAQACSFRDQYEVFKEHGAEVVGISSDSMASHQEFTSKHQLPFILLSDNEGQVRKKYKVPRTLGLIPGRVTYVIDQQGVIRYAFNSLMKPLEHVNGALNCLNELQNQQR
ncbi:peroxiredoxin [Adhaeribacter sp. BT258]|uniref:thioredoxin-dependent peroxiredoxin n=1 Tax=Adhaeribacter terrigena TaxID=2793070 RepID=A0ABS1BZ58_9BACT|nr:peroxiredoxin [Adhaeribacter terrigena]MBK0402447.1 peroxiredoxin [Adhaeribacter terrigena]